MTSKITSNKKNNLHITLDYNTLPHRQKQFFERAKYICIKEQRPFSVNDFPSISKPNFRRLILKLKPLLEIVSKGHPTFYKVKGINLPGESHKLTLDHMGLGDQFYHLLDTIRFKELCIHDITIKVLDSKLHKHLSSIGATVDRSNNAFTVGIPQFDSNIATKVTVYPESIMLYLGCTYRPLVYNVSTIWYLHEYLSKIAYHLLSLGNGILLPPVSQWICTHYHMNKDGSESLSGQSFHFTVEEVSTGMLRFYSKEMLDGKIIPRLEQVVSPNRTLENEMKVAMFATSESDLVDRIMD